jgi:hypothetical protein
MNIFRETIIACLVMVAFVAPTQAFEIYRYRMPDGTVIYTQEVSTKGSLLEVIESPAPDTKHIEEERRAILKREEAHANGVAESSGNEADIPDALDALTTAKAALIAGVAPQPGERLSIKGSPHTRLSPEYWARQLELRRSVDDAREQLDDAYSALKALK